MWIIALLEQLTGFIPRPFIIRADEGGFRQVPKLWKYRSLKDNNGSTWITEMKSGEWYWLIPWIMEYETCKIKTQVKDIRAQSVWTKDGYDITVGTSIRYYVQKPIKALLDVLDYDQSLQNIVLGMVCNYVRLRTLEELKLTVGKLEEELLKSVREASSGWGLWIQSVLITDVGKTQNFRILLSGDLLGLGIGSDV